MRRSTRTRVIELRWRARCAQCRAELGVGQRAQFDVASHEVRCLSCEDRARWTQLTLGEWADAAPRRRPPTEAERRQALETIAEARAALAARRAS